MASRRSPLESPSTAWAGDEDVPSPSPSRPLSGPGTSRQTRRLQLRNAGFRAAAVPTRKVTPKSTSTSASGLVVSDAENVSPSGTRSGSLGVSKRQSSGVLQDIGNSTLTRPKKPRPRITSAKLFAAMNSAGTSALGDEEPLSPPPPKTSIRAKTVKTRAKMSNKRRSVSAEMGKYIDHLEMELASAQSQLSAITSPSVTRQQSSKVRNLNAETKQLQQELDEWEAKYERRVQDALDEHMEHEANLRNRIRSLEDAAEESTYRIEELTSQLDDANERMAATESANVNLEKRLEIMSELLAASPTKIDLHAETPGRRKRQQRPQSMLPRFPTASSLVCSPERQSFTQPASPMLSFASHSPNMSLSPSHDMMRLDHSPHPSDAEHTDAESVFSDVLGATDSITSVETSEAQPAYNPWTLPPVRQKPARRMRRFGAGSMGPKPLILPSTSACEHFPPSSAPPLERSETTPTFFPLPANDEDGDPDLLPIFGRRRASTTAGEIRISSLESPPAFLEVPQQDEDEESMLSVLTPHAEQFRDASRDFSSIGSNVGRNLMEELSAIPTNESGESVADYTEDITDLPLDVDMEAREPLQETAAAVRDDDVSALEDSTEPGAADCSLTTTSSCTQKASHSRTRSGSANTPFHPNLSILDRLRRLFGDLWRSPVALARHLVQTAQSRMRLPSPLLNAQWWLVGILLGPMAKRRLLSQPRQPCCSADANEPLLLADHEHAQSEDEHLAYGTFHPTPPSSPHRRKSSLTGKGKKRAAGKARCAHVQQPRKHSPLMWLKFSLTLAFAVGAAFKDGPGSLLRGGGCACWLRAVEVEKSKIREGV